MMSSISQAYWPLLAHFLLVVATTIFVVFFISGNHFDSISRTTEAKEANGTISGHGFALLQTDVSTLLSAIHLLRLLGGMWTGATVWRCMFILLEKTGVTLSDFQSTISLRFPVWCFRHSYKNPANAERWTPLLVSIIIILTFPSQLSSPILTGAITWTPSNFTVRGIGGVSVPDSTADTWYWLHYSLAGNPPVIINNAAGKAVDIWGRNMPLSSGRVIRRFIPSARNLTVGSLLDNVTVPYLSIDNVQWLTTSEIQSIEIPEGNSSVTFSPFSSAAAAWVAFLPSGDWGPLPYQSPVPEPHVVEESRILAVAMGTADRTTGQGGCDDTNSGDFRIIPSSIGRKGRLVEDLDFWRCYAFANVTYRAGVATCVNCRIITPGVVQSGDVNTLKIQPHIMTSETLSLLPAVSQSMILGNSSVPPPYESDITYYVTEVLTRSYQATWATNTEQALYESNSVTYVQLSVKSSVQAQVTFWRVWLWVALNVMTTLSAPLFWIISKSSELGVVLDAECAALLLDPTTIDKYHENHLSMFGASASAVSRKVGYLRLKKAVMPPTTRGEAPVDSRSQQRWFLQNSESMSGTANISTSRRTSKVIQDDEIHERGNLKGGEDHSVSKDEA